MEGRPWSICRQSAGAPLATAGSMSIRVVLDRVFSAVDASGPRPVLAIGNGDPTASACFRPPLEAEEAVVEALRSRKHKGYSPCVGVLPARRLAAMLPPPHPHVTFIITTSKKNKSLSPKICLLKSRRKHS